MKIDCIIVDDDRMTVNLLEMMVGKFPFLNLVKSCTTAMEAAGIIMNQKIDLVFLDVEMPGMTGIELMETLKGHRPRIIMVTSKANYALEGFEYEVTDFITKPVEEKRFLKAIARVKALMETESAPTAPDAASENVLFIKVGTRLIKLLLDDIFLVEALADYVNIHTTGKKYTVHATMKSIVQQLPENLFMRVHNSYIVRLDKIKEIEDNTLLVNDKLIPVSRANRKALLGRLKML